jgi:hypothetical protein
VSRKHARTEEAEPSSEGDQDADAEGDRVAAQSADEHLSGGSDDGAGGGAEDEAPAAHLTGAAHLGSGAHAHQSDLEAFLRTISPPLSQARYLLLHACVVQHRRAYRGAMHRSTRWSLRCPPAA